MWPIPGRHFMVKKSPGLAAWYVSENPHLGDRRSTVPELREEPFPTHCAYAWDWVDFFEWKPLNDSDWRCAAIA